MRRIRKVQLSLCLVSTVPVAAILLGLSNELNLREIRSHAVVIEGTVLSGGESISSDSPMSHFLVVEFTSERDGKQVRRFQVSEDDYALANQSGTVPVTYIRSDPGLSRVGTRFEPDRRFLYLSVVALGLIAAGIVMLELVAVRRRGGKLLIQG